MLNILLTKDSTPIIGQITTLLGYLMNGIFKLLSAIGIPNIGLSIIILTLIVYLCMMPLTIKQQKFSKLSAKMNPELQAIQAKYKNKKDNDSMMAMNEETQRVYKKYGVSPTGSCLQLIIQLPIMWALYRVIYNMPAYVPSIKSVFSGLVDQLVKQNGVAEVLKTFKNASMYTKQFESEAFVNGSEFMKNTFIDVLNKASSTEWDLLADKFPSLAQDIHATYEHLSSYNYFLGLNIGNSPSVILKDALKTGSVALMIGAILVPVLAALTQYIGIKLAPQPEKSDNEQANAMAQSMKTMNMTMPIMSAVFCYTLPTGMGIYWIAGAVIRGIQQVIINKHIDKIDFDEVIRKNTEKMENEARKNGVSQSTLVNAANRNTKSISARAGYSNGMSQKEKEEAYQRAMEARINAKPGSIAAKAAKVQEYNNRNNGK